MKNIILLILGFFCLSAYAENADVADTVDTVTEKLETVEEKQAEPVEQKSMRMAAVVTNSAVDCFFRMQAPEIFFVNLARAYRGENFRYLPLFDLVVAEDGDAYKLECTMFMSKIESEGKASERQVLMDKHIIEGKLDNKFLTLVFPADLFLAFSETDEYGMHRIEFEVENLLTKEKASDVREILFQEWETPNVDFNNVQLENFIFNFNTHFDLELAYASLLSNGLNFYKKTGLNGFNPILISYYKTLFSDKDFMLDILDEEFSHMNEAHRKKVIMLNAFMDRTPYAKDLLSSEEIIFQNYMEGEFAFDLDPYEGELDDAYSLEILWGEFFARANYKPIERLLQLFKHDDAYAIKVLKKEVDSPKTESEILDYKMGSLRILLSNYIKNYKSNEVLRRYLTWALNNTTDKNIKSALNSLLSE